MQYHILSYIDSYIILGFYIISKENNGAGQRRRKLAAAL
jgi:hypothetical protein